MSDISNAPSLKEKAKNFLSEKTSTIKGMIEKSVLGSIFAAIVDFLSPLAPLARYLSVAFLCAALTLFILYKLTNNNFMKRGCRLSAILCALVGLFAVYQEVHPSTKSHGVIASNLSGIADLQTTFGIVSKKIEELNSTVSEINSASKIIAQNTGALNVTARETNSEIKNMADELKRLNSFDGVIRDPKAAAEFYHNARILSQRGETDRAISAYEELLTADKLQYTDPIVELVKLQLRLTGREGAIAYLDKIRGKLSDAQFMIAQISLQTKISQVVDRINHERDISDKVKVEFLRVFGNVFANSKDSLTTNELQAFMISFTGAESLNKIGKLREFYIDDSHANEATSIIDLVSKLDIEKIKDRVRYPFHFSFNARGLRIFLEDRISSNMPLWVCGKKLDGAQPRTIGLEVTQTKDEKEQIGSVTIKKVEPNSVGERGGLKVGDIILRINNRFTTSPTQLMFNVSNAPDDRNNSFLVRRENEKTILEIKIPDERIIVKEECFDYLSATNWNNGSELPFEIDTRGSISNYKASALATTSNGLFCISSVEFTDINSLKVKRNSFSVHESMIFWDPELASQPTYDNWRKVPPETAYLVSKIRSCDKFSFYSEDRKKFSSRAKDDVYFGNSQSQPYQTKGSFIDPTSIISDGEPK